MKKKIYIQDLKIGDSLFGELFAVKSYIKKSSRNNKPYIDLELSDNSGDIKSKIWSSEFGNCAEVKEGDVVSINATVDDFGGPQLNIKNMEIVTDYIKSEFQQTTEFDIDEMWGYVKKTIENIENPHLKKLLKSIFNKENSEKFKRSPGAYTIHHNYLGGLLEHTWEMLKMADSIKTHYPNINMDMVRTGIILHDIGKMAELDIDTSIKFFDRGKLLGHIYLGAEIVKEYAPQDIPQDLLDEVLHMVLSHIGKQEYGSPIVPKTVEAMAVYVIDYASFKIRMAYSAIQGDTGNESFTHYIPHLGTELFRSPYSDEETNQDIPF